MLGLKLSLSLKRSLTAINTRKHLEASICLWESGFLCELVTTKKEKKKRVPQSNVYDMREPWSRTCDKIQRVQIVVKISKNYTLRYSSKWKAPSLWDWLGPTLLPIIAVVLIRVLFTNIDQLNQHREQIMNKWLHLPKNGMKLIINFLLQRRFSLTTFKVKIWMRSFIPFEIMNGIIYQNHNLSWHMLLKGARNNMQYFGYF